MKALLTPLAVLISATGLLAADWPQWRGPNRDAIISDPSHPLTALPAEPKLLWRVEVGEGQASPVLAGNKLVLMEAHEGQETARCLELASGQTLWTVPVAPMVKFQNDFGDGPRCTPLIEGDRVYVQSCSGEFRCLALADGKTLWQINFGIGYGATFLGNSSDEPEAKETASRRHGNNGSAVIDGSHILVPVGGSAQGATLVAFDKLTGKEIWRVGKDNTAYSSVMVGTLAGTRQAIHFTADALMGVEASTGRLLWRVPLKTGAKRHVCTPVIVGDTVTVASTSIGTLQFRISHSGTDWTAEPVWANTSLKTNMATAVQVGAHFYTLGAGSRTDMVCLEASTGTVLWSQRGFGDYAAFLAINDRVLALNSTGELFVLKANAAKYELQARFQVCAKTWTSPAYADGKLYVKDAAHLTALQLGE